MISRNACHCGFIRFIYLECVSPQTTVSGQLWCDVMFSACFFGDSFLIHFVSAE